jgi:hypothetical protein
LIYLLALKYKYILIKERLSIKNIIEKGNNPLVFIDRGLLEVIISVLSSLDVHGILINGIINKLIKLSSNNKLEGDNNSLNTRHVCRIINSRKPGNNAFILK